MQSILDDGVQKRLLKKLRFKLAAKGVFRLGRCYMIRQGVPGLWVNKDSCIHPFDKQRKVNDLG